MAGITLDMRISIGHVISAGAALMTVAILYGALKAKDEVLTSQLSAEAAARDALELKINSIALDARTERAGIENRLRQAEQDLARTDERFSLIMTTLSEIKAQVSENKGFGQ